MRLCMFSFELDKAFGSVISFFLSFPFPKLISWLQRELIILWKAYKKSDKQLTKHCNVQLLMLYWAPLHNNYGNITINDISAIYGNYHSNTAP